MFNRRSRTRKAEFAIETRGKDAGAIRTRREVLAIQDRQTFCIPGKQISEGIAKLRLAVLAEPLQFVFVTLGPKASQLRNPRIKPAQRIGKRKRVQLLDGVVFAHGDEASDAVHTLVEGQEQGAGKVGSVKGAGSVTEMMIEA